MAHLMRIISLTLLFLANQTSGSHYATIVNGNVAGGLVHAHLSASHSYLFLEIALNNMDWDLPGLKTFLRKQSNEKRELAIQLMEYQDRRGGNVSIIDNLSFPGRKFETPYDIVQEFYNTEKKVEMTVLDIYNESRLTKDIVFANRLITILERLAEVLSEITKTKIYLRKLRGKNFGCTAVNKFLCSTDF